MELSGTIKENKGWYLVGAIKNWQRLADSWQLSLARVKPLGHPILNHHSVTEEPKKPPSKPRIILTRPSKL